tara:strand:- start:3 stop:1166 length:1164 start_codon:yes stop_codon:yes gene_type:complete
MNKSDSSSSKLRWLKLLFIPLVWIAKLLDKHFVSFIRGRVLKDETRVYSLRFVWYSDSVYLHPMIWGSLVLWFLATNAVVVESDDVAAAATGASQAAVAEGDTAATTPSDSATAATSDTSPAATDDAGAEAGDTDVSGQTDGETEGQPAEAQAEKTGMAAWGLKPGWLTMVWFISLGVCYMTTMHNFNVLRVAILIVVVLAVLGGSYYATHELELDLLAGVISHLDSLQATVTPGFYLVSAYFFAGLIVCEVFWAWLFQRVEIDESYVYEFRFLMGTAREPIFARGLRRETKDLLELALMGAADITHRTKNGVKRFPNVPFASLWLGLAFDKMLDYRRTGQIELEKRRQKDQSDQARLQDAMEEISEDWQEDAPDTSAEDVDPDDVN